MSSAAPVDPTGRYKGANYDPHYREKRQAERERSGHYDRGHPPAPYHDPVYPRRGSGGPPPPPRSYDPRPPSHGNGGRPPWEEREYRERPYDRDAGSGPVPSGRPPWEEREREGTYKRSPRDSHHMALRESYIPPVKRNGDDYSHSQPTRPSRYDTNPNGERAVDPRQENGESHVHSNAHSQPSRAYSPSAPTDSIRSVDIQPHNQAQTPSLTSQNLATIPVIVEPEDTDENRQTLSESGVENSLDSLAKLQQFKAEVEASRTRRATTELEPNKLALMAESFLLAQQAPEPGEVLEDEAGESNVTDQQRLAEAKIREQELKERLLKAKQAESNGQTNGVASNIPPTQVKREREDDPAHLKTEHKRPKAEDIAMSETQRPDARPAEQSGEGKGGPNYRLSERNFVPERFRDASHEEVQRRAAAAFAVAARDQAPRDAVRRRSIERGYQDGRGPIKEAPPSEGRSLLHRISGGPGHRARSPSPKSYRRPVSPSRGPGYGRPPSPGRTLDSRIGGRYAPPPPGPAIYSASPPRRPRDLPPPAARAPEAAYDRAPPREYERERERPNVENRRDPAYPNNARDDRYPERYANESRAPYRPTAEPAYVAREPAPAAPAQAPIAVTSMVTTLAALKAQIALLESQIPVTPAPSAIAPPSPASSSYPSSDRYAYDSRAQDRDRERGRPPPPPPPPAASFDNRDRVRPASPPRSREVYGNASERYSTGGPGPSRDYDDRPSKGRGYDPDAMHPYHRDREVPPPPGPTYEEMHAGDRYDERRYDGEYRRGGGPDRGRGRGRGGGSSVGRGGYR